MKLGQELEMSRRAFQRALDNLDFERASRYYPMKCGFRTDFGYALEVQKVIFEYDRLIKELG